MPVVSGRANQPMTWTAPTCGVADDRGSPCLLGTGHAGPHAGEAQLGLSRWPAAYGGLRPGRVSLWAIALFVVIVVLAGVLLDALGFPGLPR